MINTDNKPKTYVTGMGIMTSIGDSISTFEEALRAGKSGITYSKERSVNHTKAICAEIEEESLTRCLHTYLQNMEMPDKTRNMAKRLGRRAPFPVKAVLPAVFEAFDQAGLFGNPVEGERISLVVAGSNLSNGLQQHSYVKSRQNPEYLSPQLALQFMDTYHVGVLSELFGMKGEGFTVGGASASGNAAIIKARQLMELGLADCCIVVGAAADLTDMELQTYFNIGALGGKAYAGFPQKACRPFDTGHEGFLYGQAAGCLVLETEESVKKREGKPIAEIAGGKMKLDGNHSSNPNEKGESQVMSDVMKEAFVLPEQVDYINAHGSSSALGDETESKAIKHVFGENVSRIWVNSTKGLTGHCLYSAGVVEAIAAIIQMRAGFVHPNINLDEPIDKEVKFAGKSMIPAKLNTALSNSFGFGGINTSILIKKV